jgi:hypothetical protein
VGADVREWIDLSNPRIGYGQASNWETTDE